jgi:hypothetical protein
MARWVVLFAAALVSTTCTPQPKEPTMSALQHCQLAVTLAYNGECLLSGQHLSFCNGPNRDSSFAYAQSMCGRRWSSTPATTSTALVNGTVRAPAAPNANDACDEAVKEALFGGCADAVRSLAACRGERRDETKTKVDHWCSRTTLPETDPANDVFRTR